MAKKLSVPEAFIGQACDVFKLMSDKTRLGILLHLMESEHSVGELCVKLDLPQPTVSHHLALMRMSRLIQKRRRGKQMIYSINIDLLRGLADDAFKYMSANGKTIQADRYTFSKKK
ncbi:MAG TPA: metalloregulator ArsR/SmtB family transcription factor [Planctomycetota bacterium]|nr:metalloregulator ArsR/SmtB family transcription factor [Planctomycetota bacterium]